MLELTVTDLVIITLVVLIVCLFLSTITKRIKGGEYVLAKHGEERIKPTPSQIRYDSLSPLEFIKLSKECGIEKLSPIFLEMLAESAKTLETNATYKWRGEMARFTSNKADTFRVPSTISDAYIDLIGLITNTKNVVERACAVVEWHGDEFACESNDFVASFNRNESNFIQNIKDPDYFNTNWFDFDNENLILKRNIETLLKTNPINSFIESLDNEALNFTDFERRDIIAVLNSAHADKRWRDTKNDVVKKAVERQFLESYSKLTHFPKTDCSIYIEFAYSSALRSTDAYYNIHYRTAEVLKYVFEDKTDMTIFVFRFAVDDNGVVDSFHQNKVIDNLNIKTFDSVHTTQTFSQDTKTRFRKATIPKTLISSPLSYDEGMFVETVDKNYDIQIEHSENLGSHKSNIIEFVCRSLFNRGIRDGNLVKRYLHEVLNYNLTETGTIDFELKNASAGVPLERRRLFSRCQRFDSPIFAE